MIELTKGYRVKYKNRVVGVIKNFASNWIFEWKQNPITKKSTAEYTVYGMEEGLLEMLEDAEVDFIEIDSQMIPVESIRDNNKLYPNDPFFNEPRDELQFLIKVEKR